MRQEERWYWRSIDGNWTRKPVAYCKTKKAVLTEKQMKTHRCKKRHCMHLDEGVVFE